ncbi:MAG: 4Fe-4S binding protein [archaeon]|nr:4Fe-4S binding protein [archaeon]
MDVSFKKQKKALEQEVLMKSVDLDDDVEDFSFDLEQFEFEENVISVSPKCIRCNLCYNECPMDAIESSNAFRIAKITEKCVKCEICVQSCPVSAIKMVKNMAFYNEDEGLEYRVINISRSHRTIRMNNISVDLSKCGTCGVPCTEFCPTGAISPQFADEFDVDIELEEDTLYPKLNDKLCIGCGSCVNLCEFGAIDLDRTIGPLVHDKQLEINQDICVNCYLCEENCPVDSIKLVNGEVVLDNETCIRCESCSYHCPVGALKLVDIR